MTKSLQPFAIFAALSLGSACASMAQVKAPQAPVAKPRIAPGTEAPSPGSQTPEPRAAEPKPAGPKAPEPKAANPKVPEPKVAAPTPRRAPTTLEEMLRGQRDARWERERSVLRQSLEEAGLGDKVLQDAVVDFAVQQDASREALRAVSARCWDALRNPNTDTDELNSLLKSYQDAATAAQSEREKGLAALEEKVHWKSSARLQMLLRLKGLLGSEAWLAGDALDASESLDLRILYPPTQ